MKRLFLISACLIILLTGCSSKDTVPTETTETAADVRITIDDEIETSVEMTSKDETETIETTEDNFYQLPPYEYSGNDGIEKAIMEFFREADIYLRPRESVMIPALCIFREENTDDNFPVQNDVKVYGNFWMFVYTKQGKTLFIDGKEYSITDVESLKWIEDSFSRADELKGWPNCPYDAELVLVREDGASFKIQVATDSCNNLKTEDIWYCYHTQTDDNTPFYDLFGIKVLFGKIVE